MVGLAKKLFNEVAGYSPFDCNETTTHPKWPLISKLLEAGYLQSIDYLIAENLSKECGGDHESVIALICHLSLAVKNGHLCIRIDENEIYPTVDSLWKAIDRNNVPLPLEQVEELTQLILEGKNILSPNFLTSLDQISDKCPSTPICLFNNLFYFQRYWYYETAFIESLEKLNQHKVKLTFDDTLINATMKEMLLAGQLLPEQAKAIANAFKNQFSIICGGPGTGKTYTAGMFVTTFWNLLPLDIQETCEIVLAAPTGKAAANLQNTFNRFASNLKMSKPIKAQTIHSLLEIRKARNNIQIKTLNADLILIDESSMLDVRLMALLFSAIKPGARLILLGDRYQLPPVDVGNVFADIIKHLETNSQSVVELKTCMRTELESIIYLANAIKKGNVDDVLAFLEQKPEGIIRKISSTDKEHVMALQEQLIQYTLQYFPYSFENQLIPDLFHTFPKFRILSPLRQGPLAVDSINAHFLQILGKKMRRNEWFIAPIMIVSNDANQNLSNGEVGLLIRKWNGLPGISYFSENDYAVFPSKDISEGDHVAQLKNIPALLLPKFEYAYCISIHKSQGSEFDHVLVVLPEGSEFFGREVLYTGLTRAKKCLEIWGSDHILKQTILNQGHRLSGIGTRLQLENKKRV